MTDPMRDHIESLIAAACDGSYFGLQNAHFIEHGEVTPQKLADNIVEYVTELIQEMTECLT